MAKVWSTSPAGLKLIQTFEGCEKRRPDGTLEVYQVGADLPTVGWGQTGQMPDGRPVIKGLTITQQEADDALMFFVRNVVDPLVRKHFVCQTQAEHDACASWVYNINHAKLERGEYSLPTLVNLRARDFDAVVNKWIQYKNPNTIFEQGLYRRRLAELCVFLGLPWHFALSAVLKRREGIIVDMTDPAYILEMAEAARPIASLPDPPKAPKPVIEVKVEPLPEIAPRVDPVAPPKPMETSKTHKGLSKKESGQETTIIGGTLAGMAIFLPYIDALTAFLSKYPATVIFSSLGVIGLLTIGVGAWRWWVGKMMAFEGRQEAVQAKI